MELEAMEYGASDEVKDEYIEAYNEHMSELGAESAALWERYEADYEAWVRDEQPVRKDIAPIILMSDLFKRPKMPVTAYVPDFIYAGAINGVFATPKTGKSTLIWYLLNAISRGGKVFGRQATLGNVLYVSEQNEACFREQAEDVPGLSTNGKIGILLAEHNRRGDNGQQYQIASWETQLAFWQERIRAFDPDVFVLDTLGAFFHLPAGGENDNGVMQQRMAQLRLLFDVKPNIAIVIVHHARKEYENGRSQVRGDDSKYGDGSSIRGASALLGALDHSIVMTRPKGEGSKGSPKRYLSFQGRYPDSNDMTMDIERKPDMSYVVTKYSRPSENDQPLMSHQEEVRQDQINELSKALPFSSEDAVSMKDLQTATGISSRTLKYLLKDVKALMIGKGIKGDPIRYYQIGMAAPAQP
jgi:hypothetical protein